MFESQNKVRLPETFLKVSFLEPNNTTYENTFHSIDLELPHCEIVAPSSVGTFVVALLGDNWTEMSC